MFTCNVLNNKCFRQMKPARLWKNVILWAISRREFRLRLSSLKKKSINLHRGLQIYTSNREYIIQIPSAPPSFMGIWAIQSPLKRHCYTCMSFKTYWSRLIYTKLSPHRSFVINMYVVTMVWRCISPRSFHRSPRENEKWIFFIYVSRFPLSEVKTKKKQKKHRKT